MSSKEPDVHSLLGIIEITFPYTSVRRRSICTDLDQIENLITKLGTAYEHEDIDYIGSLLGDLNYCVSSLSDAKEIIEFSDDYEDYASYWVKETESRLDEDELLELEQQKILHRLSNGK
jgi:hypothetical protein